MVLVETRRCHTFGNGNHDGHEQTRKSGQTGCLKNETINFKDGNPPLRVLVVGIVFPQSFHHIFCRGDVR